MKNCQVCGNPIFNQKHMGHNKDGSLNEDFCSSCFKNGHFVNDIGPDSDAGFFFPLAFNDAARPQ